MCDAFPAEPGQPLAAAWATIATTLGRSASSHCRDEAAPLTGVNIPVLSNA